MFRHIVKQRRKKKANNITPDETNVPQENTNQDRNAIEESSLPKNAYILSERRKKRERWKENKRAGLFYEEVQKNYIDKKGSFQWLQNGDLTLNEERLVIAAQDQGIMTNGLRKVCGLSDSDKCRFCKTQVESPGHLMSGCKILMSDGQYTKRHNKVCKYLHWTILNEKNIPTKQVWLHEPEPVTAKDEVTVFYDKIIPTGRFIES